MLVLEDVFHRLVNGHLFDTRDFQCFHPDGVLDKPQVILLPELDVFLRL